MTGEARAPQYFEESAADPHIKRKALRGGSLMIVSRGANTVIQMASTVVLARLLTPEDFGLVAMVTAFSLLLYNVGFNGFTEAIIQAERIRHKQVSTLFWIGLAISAGLALVFAASSPLLARFYKEPRLVAISIVFASGFVFSALATEHLALMTRRMEFHKIVLNEMLSLVISVIVAIAMALKGFGYWAIVARQMAVPVAGAGLAWVQCAWRPGLPVRNAGTRPMMKFAVSTFGNFAMNYFGRNVDKILLGWRWGSQELGNYDRAYRLFILPVNQMVSPLSGVALATLSRLRGEPEKFRRYFLKSVSLLGLLGMLVSTILTVAGQDIIALLLGAQWHKAGLIFSAFGPSIGITLIYGTHGWLHLSLGTPGRWFKWGAFALAITAVMLGVGLLWGGLGIAIAYGLSFYVLTAPALIYAGRPAGLRLKAIWQVLWRPLAASVLSGAASWILLMPGGLFWGFSGGLGLLLRIAVLSAACTVLYLSLIVALHGGLEPLRNLVRLIREVLPGRKAPLADES